MPRSSKRVVLAAGNNSFAGNPKHLYFYLQEKMPDFKTVWITKDKEVYNFLKKKDLDVEMYYSFSGVWVCLRAKFWFYNMSFSDLNYYASAGAIKVNLWHGTPVKMIGRDTKKMARGIPSSAPQKLGIVTKIFNRINNPHHYISADYFVSSSEYTTQKIFKSAFGLADEKYLAFGYPRSDIFFWEKSKIEKFIFNFESESIQRFIKEIKVYDKVYFYLPTFRDSDRDFIKDAGIDLGKLNAAMQKSNSVFVFKMHPRTQIDLSEINSYSHLKVLQKEADIYTIMPFTDCLISDYSSVYFDYLLLEKEIVLFPFDLEEYLKDSRALYFDYQEVMKGKTAFSFKGLLSLFNENNQEENTAYENAQRKLRNLFWDDYAGKSGEQLLRFLKEKN